MPEFVDSAQLHAKAGNGGAGAVSFRREAFVDKGGPDGGDGGDGGSVIVIPTPRLNSLVGFRDHPHKRAQDGAHGSSKKKRGARGADTFVEVPLGTVIKSLSGEVMADLNRLDLSFCAARGGRGGKGNSGFLSNKRRAPDFAEQGELGEELWFNLELKLVTDVALVGLPNVGKSSIIANISRAKPKIGDYPFTTLIPTLGVVSLGSGSDQAELIVADVPGLVEGASDGKGLGLEFLRHVERAKVLAIVVDASELVGESIEKQVAVVLGELERYLHDLSDRPLILVANKRDLVVSEVNVTERVQRLAREIDAVSNAWVSATSRTGLQELVVAMFQAQHAAHGEFSRANANETVYRPLSDREFHVERIEVGRFLVTGRDALRAVRLSDLSSLAAQDIMQKRLENLGVMRALRRLGISEGDEVTVGDISFTYEDGI